MSEEVDSGNGHGYGSSIGLVADEDGGYSFPSEDPEPLMTETNCQPRARYRMVSTVDSESTTHEQEASQQAAAAAKEGLTGVSGFDSVGGGVSGSGGDGNDNDKYKNRESDSEGVSIFREIGHGVADVGGGVLLAQRAEDAESGGEGKAAPAPIRAPSTGDYMSGEALGTGVERIEKNSMKVRRVWRGGARGECGFDKLSLEYARVTFKIEWCFEWKPNGACFFVCNICLVLFCFFL